MELTLEPIIEIIKKAGVLLKDRHAAENIHQKGVSDYVTAVDLKVQEYIKTKLGNFYPDIQFMGEEEQNFEIDFTKKVWVLDPVDGTTNIIHDYRHSAISLALLENKKTIMGFIYQPYSNEMFWAMTGEGAFLNGEKIHVSNITSMDKSLISIGTSPYYKEFAQKNFKVFESVFMDCQDIRRSGSASLDLAYVACGRVEAYFERNLKLWDYAAGILLVTEAGGIISNYDGDEITADYMTNVIAGNQYISKILLSLYL